VNPKAKVHTHIQPEEGMIHQKPTKWAKTKKNCSNTVLLNNILYN
jgi:hypothetical protein